MYSVVVFGGSGGLGSQVVPLLEQKYSVISLSSKDVDITDFLAVRAFFDQNKADVVINLSGANYNQFIHKIGEAHQTEIERLVQVNIMGTINILSNALPGMRERNFGRIILMSSILATAPVPGTGLYSGCKGFLDAITKTVSVENASKGITCNSIRLGYFDGGLLYEIPEQLREQIREKIPVKRWGSIQEFYQVLDMIISTGYLTGVNLPVNGGLDY